MKRIIKRLKRSASKIGYLMAVIAGLAAMPLAFIDIRWCLLILIVAVILAILSTAVALFNIHRNVLSVTKRLKDLTTRVETGNKVPGELDTPDELILRELHLRTLEEVRMLHAEMINYLETSKER